MFVCVSVCVYVRVCFACELGHQNSVCPAGVCKSSDIFVLKLSWNCCFPFCDIWWFLSSNSLTRDSCMARASKLLWGDLCTGLSQICVKLYGIPRRKAAIKPSLGHCEGTREAVRMWAAKPQFFFGFGRAIPEFTLLICTWYMKGSSLPLGI